MSAPNLSSSVSFSLKGKAIPLDNQRMLQNGVTSETAALSRHWPVVASVVEWYTRFQMNVMGPGMIRKPLG